MSQFIQANPNTFGVTKTELGNEVWLLIEPVLAWKIEKSAFDGIESEDVWPVMTDGDENQEFYIHGGKTVQIVGGSAIYVGISLMDALHFIGDYVATEYRGSKFQKVCCKLGSINFEIKT